MPLQVILPQARYLKARLPLTQIDFAPAVVERAI